MSMGLGGSCCNADACHHCVLATNDVNLTRARRCQLRDAGEAISIRTSGPKKKALKSLSPKQLQRRQEGQKKRTLLIVGCTGRCASTCLSANFTAAGAKITHERANPAGPDAKMGGSTKDQFALQKASNKVKQAAAARMIRSLDEQAAVSDKLAGDISHTNIDFLEQALNLDNILVLVVRPTLWVSYICCFKTTNIC